MARIRSETYGACMARARRNDRYTARMLDVARSWKRYELDCVAFGMTDQAAHAREFRRNAVILARSFARSARFERRSAVHALRRAAFRARHTNRGAF